MTQLDKCREPEYLQDPGPQETRSIDVLQEAAAFYGPKAVVLTAMYELGTLPYYDQEQLDQIEAQLEGAYKDYWFKFIGRDIDNRPSQTREAVLRDMTGIIEDDLALASIRAFRQTLRESDAEPHASLQARHAENLVRLMLQDEANKLHAANRPPIESDD